MYFVDWLERKQIQKFAGSFQIKINASSTFDVSYTLQLETHQVPFQFTTTRTSKENIYDNNRNKSNGNRIYYQHLR